MRLSLIIICFLITSCSTTIPAWRTLTTAGVNGVKQIDEYPVNPSPADFKEVEAFELFDDQEPAQLSYYVDDYNVATPLSIADATLLSTEKLLLMLQDSVKPNKRPILIDVRSRNERIITLQGAWWLNGLGYAYEEEKLDKKIDDRMKETLTVLTGGRILKPLVFFCANPRCALSFNAARRASKLEHYAVYWYRGGTEAWYLAGLPLVILSIKNP